MPAQTTCTDRQIADIVDDNDNPLTVECEWFARCGQPATQALSHPILDWVPTCPRCIERATRP